MSIFRTRYRIVTDAYAGYEVQFRYWWIPFYIQYEINTHQSIEAARAFMSKISKVNTVVEYSQ